MNGRNAIAVAATLIAVLFMTACGGNIGEDTGEKLHRGIYHAEFDYRGRSVNCFVLTKEFSKGDQHAIAIDCPDWANGGSR